MNLDKPDCQFCHTNRRAQPCELPEDQHKAGIVIHEGPDRFGNYVYTRYWWNDSTLRQRAQVFRSTQHMETDEWREAWKVWRSGKCRTT
jgi:hypothetical protein